MPLPKKVAVPPVHSLTAEELKKPMLAVEDFFDFADLADARQLLWTWLKCTVAGNFHKELNASERAAILTLYEKTVRLMESAWLMHQANQPKK